MSIHWDAELCDGETGSMSNSKVQRCVLSRGVVIFASTSSVADVDVNLVADVTAAGDKKVGPS